MIRFQVKVCGLTDPRDAALAASLGADLIGVIFYRKSPRYVSQSLAETVLEAVPPKVARVGVFVAEQLDRVLAMAHSLKLDFLQFQGVYTGRDVTIAQGEGLKVIQTFHVKAPSDYEAVYASRADLILLDNRTSAQPGGTGRRFDWRLTPPRRIPNLMLAGGISVDNVEEGVRKFAPLVVDVNSGVEAAPGVKSAARLREFFRRCDELRDEK